MKKRRIGQAGAACVGGRARGACRCRPRIDVRAPRATARARVKVVVARRDDGPILIGGTVSLTSAAASFPEVKQAQQAAVDSINDAGGINGRQLKLEVCDSKFEVAAELACFRSLTETWQRSSVPWSSPIPASPSTRWPRPPKRP